MTPFSQIEEITSLPGFQFESCCRHYAKYAYLEDNTALCIVLTKYKLYIATQDESIAPHLMMDGFWETWLTQFLAGTVKKGNVCFDIGANFGYYSILMSALSGSNGRVVAVEANKTIAGMLRNTSCINKPGFEVCELALSNEEGSAALMIPSNYLGGSSIIHQDIMAQFQTQVQNTRATSLDILANELNINKIDVIKIDVEGAEPMVFEGMKYVLKNNPQIKIVMEYSPHLYNDPKEFTRYLFKNFEVFRIKDVEKITQLDKKSIPELLNLKDHTDLYLLKKGGLKKFFSFFINSLA